MNAISGRTPAKNGQMAEAVERLSELLREENAALSAMDFARAGGLLAPKHAAADALAAAWRAAEPDHVAPEAMHTLGVLAEENRQLLKRAMRVQRRVLDMVARAAKTALRSPSYGAGGKPTAARVKPQNLVSRA
jgi:hypothetical protein